MVACGLILAALFTSLVVTSYGQFFFSKLPQTLTVDISPPGTVNITAGVGQIAVRWGLNQSLNDIDTSSYKTVKVKLCYLPESQKDRPWRKTEDDLVKDKTCQHDITSKPYSQSNNSVTCTVQKDVPTADYFIRAYVVNAAGKQVAYGQTTGSRLSVIAITGRKASIEIASVVFSALSVVSLAGFFYLEKRKAKRGT